MKTNKNSVRITLYLSDTMNAMLTRLRDDRVDTSFSETIRECIRALYTKTYPEYKEKITLSTKTILTDEQKETMEKLQAQKVKTKQKQICLLLGGKMNKEETECTYYVYDEKLRFEQTVPLSTLNENMVETQYTPSRERVKELQDKKQVLYDMDNNA